MRQMLGVESGNAGAVGGRHERGRDEDATETYRRGGERAARDSQRADKDIPQDLWQKAECVAVIPSVKKAAFVVGGEYGKGVMSCREGSAWSAPSFVLLEKGSVGFQIGRGGPCGSRAAGDERPAA